uniref:Uncharacterized protein n=1 Tax=Oryza brachyantha TaxID=4533 RepID=J3ME02_ORYBR
MAKGQENRVLPRITIQVWWWRTSRTIATRPMRAITALTTGIDQRDGAMSVATHRNGARLSRMLEKMASKEPETTGELFELVDRVARREEIWAWNAFRCSHIYPYRNGIRRRHQEKVWIWTDEASNRRRDRRKVMIKGLSSPWTALHVHSARGRPRAAMASLPTQSEPAVATIDGGACAHASRRSFKAMKSELLATVPSHEAEWRSRRAEVSLTFDQTDHPVSVDGSGHLALLTSPTIYAALNLLCPKTIDTIKVWPLVQISLPITFKGPSNFSTERVDFEVVDLSLPYNVMLGRLPLVKFIVATHYAYRQLKMPGPSGPITVHSNLKMALACTEMRGEALAMATTVMSADQGP